VNLEMIGWREAILVLVGLAVAYVLVTVIRLVWVGKKKRAGHSVFDPATVDVKMGVSNAEPELGVAEDLWQPISVEGKVRQTALSGRRGMEQSPTEPTATPATPVTPTTPAAPGPTGFEEHLAGQLARFDLEREVRILRNEVDALKVELREIRAARNVSPQYSEALALVQRGMTAQDIADRMEISLAEAELVHALGRGESTFEEGALDGSDREDSSLSLPRTERY
jgi:hypothetical protein